MPEETCPTCSGAGKIQVVQRAPGVPVWQDRNFIINIITVLVMAFGGYKLNDKTNDINVKTNTIEEKADKAAEHAAVAANNAAVSAEITKENSRVIKDTRDDVKTVRDKVGGKSK